MLNQHDPGSALVHNSFELTMLRCKSLTKVQIEELQVSSIHLVRHAVKADERQKLKISNGLANNTDRTYCVQKLSTWSAAFGASYW